MGLHLPTCSFEDMLHYAVDLFVGTDQIIRLYKFWTFLCCRMWGICPAWTAIRDWWRGAD